MLIAWLANAGGPATRRVIMVAMAATVEGTSRYQFKAAPYSSHTLLLAEFPERGEGRRVLDVGCAIGYLSEILARRGYAVTSIDWPNSPHPPTVEFAGADLDNGLPPLRGQFDYVICADVLEHLRAPLELLKECCARLAPGGTLVGSLPNSGHFYFRWTVLTGRFPQHQRGLFDSTHLHFYTWDGWTGLLGRAGLRVESVRCSGVPLSLAFPQLAGTPPLRLLEWLSFQAARIWKTMCAYQFIVRARAERTG
jgi:SAM-dependent methyltransferase